MFKELVKMQQGVPASISTSSVCFFFFFKSLSRIQLFGNPMDYSPPGSSVHGISQVRILGWVAISSSRASSQPRDRTHVSCIGRWILYPLSHHGSPHISPIHPFIYPPSIHHVSANDSSIHPLSTHPTIIYPSIHRPLTHSSFIHSHSSAVHTPSIHPFTIHLSSIPSSTIHHLPTHPPIPSCIHCYK